MDELTFNLKTDHISVIRDALETQIGNIEERIANNNIDNEEKERLQHCLKIRHEVLDPILRMSIKNGGVINFTK